MKLSHFSLAALLLAAAALAQAGAPTSGKAALEASVAVKEESAFDQIWGLTKLYENKDHPVLQELRFTGRYHGQYHWSEGDDTSNEAWEDRRFRLGLEAKLFNDITLKGEMVSGSDFDPFYNGFTELYLQWNPLDAFAIIAGRQKPRFTNDWSTGSRYHNYLERSALLNQFRPDYTPGVAFTGKLGKFNYYTGVFSNSPSDELSDEFGNIEGISFIAQIGYDLKETLGTDSADWRLEYLCSDSNEDSTIFNHFENGLATSLSVRSGKASLITELLYGVGSESGDVFGVNLQPGYFVTDKLQVVGRYQVATSNGSEGISAQRRYERTVGLGKGGLYKAGYVGANYYIYGNKLKLMGGLEYSTLGGEEQWTGLLGVRVFWGAEVKGSFPTGYPYTTD